jgi:predicted nucleotidyltransferase
MDRRDSAPLVTREALEEFTQRLVEHFVPEQVLLFGSQARGDARQDSDADILVVMPFEGDCSPRAAKFAGPASPVFALIC